MLFQLSTLTHERCACAWFFLEIPLSCISQLIKKSVTSSNVDSKILLHQKYLQCTSCLNYNCISKTTYFSQFCLFFLYIMLFKKLYYLYEKAIISKYKLMENFGIHSEQNKLKRSLEFCTSCISTALPMFSPYNISVWSAALLQL